MENDLDAFLKTSIPEKNYKFQWTVEKFSKLPLKEEIRSPDIYPEKRHRIPWRASFTIHDLSLKLNLYRYFAREAVIIDCVAKILDCDGKVYYENSEKAYNPGEPTFNRALFKDTSINFKDIESTTLKELKAAPNDTWNFIFIINTSEMVTKFESFSSKQENEEKVRRSLADNLLKMFENQTGTDVTLLVQDDKIEVHKTVLCAQSAVFAKMFETPMSESEKNTVVIDDVSVAAMKELINYMYCKVNTEYSIETALEIYYAADKYKVRDLREICRNIFISRIDYQNAGLLFELAYKHKDMYLKYQVRAYVHSHMTYCVQESWWTELSKKVELFAELLDFP